LLLALLPLLLLRPRGKDLVHSPRQRSVLLLRCAAQLRLQLGFDQRSNELGAGFHAATVGHSRGWQQRTLVHDVPDNQIGWHRGPAAARGWLFGERERREGQIMNELVTVLKAADAAARWHVNQRRKGAAQEPYITHLLEVAMLVAEATAGADPNLIVAALLHDTIEDQGVTREEIAAHFNDDVADLVVEVTDNKKLPKA